MNVSAAFAIPAMIAHQGGWDEALLIATPILIIIALLRVAKRRVDAAHDAALAAEAADQPHDTADDHADSGPT